MTDIYIVSGFLGAGKTTWIQKMLKESFQGQRVVLIENDFGQASVDAAILKHQGVEVREISSGCICCSLAGDFVRAITEILNCFAPDVLLIEPSGVGKLSDVVRACHDNAVQALLHLAGGMTVVDATRFALYMENFGEFYEDQIQQADVILVSHLNSSAQKGEDVRLAVEKINPHAAVFDMPWDRLSANDVLHHLPDSPFAKTPCSGGHHCEEHGGHDHREGCSCGRNCSEHNHNGEEHDHDCGHEGHHDAEEVFDSFTLSTGRIFDKQEIVACFQRVESLRCNIVRAKGILQGEGSSWNVQYVPGQTEITPIQAPAGMISFIGQNLDKEDIRRLFENT